MPLLVGAGENKINDIQWINKVDEGVANIAVVGEIDSKIHEVIAAVAALINDALQHGLVNFIWNIAKHDSRPNVDTLLNAVDIDVVVMANGLIRILTTSHLALRGSDGILATVGTTIELGNIAGVCRRLRQITKILVKALGACCKTTKPRLSESASREGLWRITWRDESIISTVRNLRLSLERAGKGWLKWCDRRSRIQAVQDVRNTGRLKTKRICCQVWDASRVRTASVEQWIVCRESGSVNIVVNRNLTKGVAKVRCICRTTSGSCDWSSVMSMISRLCNIINIWTMRFDFDDDRL
jgi:hypothetical protein